MIEVLYFAWLRERIGAPSEKVKTDATTIFELIEELKQREERYALAFSDCAAIRAAVDQELVDDFNASILGAKEVAFFPPMTGG